MICCDTCASILPSQQQGPLHSHDIPARPFQHVSADIFNASGCDFLVLVDHFSGWPSVAKLHNSTPTTDVLRQLKHWITDYGAPVKLVPDNGPQFWSAEFQHFCKECIWYITHVTSSPYNPQSNGIAEAIARNGHMLRDMGVGTSRHEDDQLPCRRRSRSELDPRTTTARGLLGWETRRAVWENRRSQPQVDFDACVVELESAWICDEEE